MGRLFVVLLAFFITGVPKMRACRVYGRMYYRETSLEGVPPLCRNEGIVNYVNAQYRSHFGVNLRHSIKQLKGLIDSGCSDILGRFLCTAHFPQLDLLRAGEQLYYPGPIFRRPCVETCRAIWRDCRHAARQLGIERTAELACNRSDFPSQKFDQCFTYLKPPRDQPQLIQADRLNASSASILFALPEEASVTEGFLVRYNETVSWGQVEREIAHLINQSHEYGRWKVTDLKSVRGYKFEVTAMNAYGEGLKAVISVPAFSGVSEIGTECEDITVSVCQYGIGYQQTALPNSLGIWDQEDAETEAKQLATIVEFDCSPYTQRLLCAMYTPRCTSGLSSTLLPCKDLCVQARNGCAQMLMDGGYPWPYQLECENLPRYNGDNNCYLGDAPLLDVETDDQCENITVSWCPPAVGYNRTWMPNSIGHQTVREAELQLRTFSPVNQIECSPHFGSFVCSMYLPWCNSAPILPCRELCEEARKGCLPVLREFGFSWPEQLACEDLPSHRDGVTCYLGDFQPQSNVIKDPAATRGIKPRRKDIHNLGVPSLIHGWVDVQGQGAANDYCRVVLNSTGDYFLSCSLAGMEGAATDLDYNSTGPWFDAGHMDTWYMRDVNEDGRDDYCRCVGCMPTTHVSCLLAGEGAFDGQTFDYDPVPGGCHYTKVHQRFGP